MNESLMGREGGGTTGRSTSENVLADLWCRMYEKRQESAATPEETTEIASPDYCLESEGTQGSTSHSTPQDENGRVVRRGEQPGKA